MNKLKRGFITTYVALLMVVSALVMQSAALTSEQKSVIKIQLDNIINKEQTITVNNPTGSQIINEPTEEGTETESPISNEGILKTEAEEYYADVFPSKSGKFSNGIEWATGTSREYGGWKHYGLDVYFKGGNNDEFPLSWLIEKNYIPVSIYDISREKKVYDCEQGLYLESNNYLTWADPNVKTNCETFLSLTPDEQNKFNQDFIISHGYNYF